MSVSFELTICMTSPLYCTGKGPQILTFTRHSRPLSSEGSLACQTFCNTGHPFIMDTSKDPKHTHEAERLAVEPSLPVLTT